MSHQEKKALLNLGTYFTAIGIYANYVYNHYWDPGMTTDELLVFWSKFLLISIPVQIVIHIIVHILMNIARGMANGGKLKEEIEDEFDKIIDLKASRNGFIVFAIGMMAALGYLATGHGVTYFFLAMIISGMVSEIIEASSRIYFYRMGV